MYKLSVLIPSLHERHKELHELVKSINQQRSTQNDVEILSIVDDRSMTTGKKRNYLLHMSSGQYVCFIDDDDDISHDYISQIVRNANSNTDCFSLNGEIIFSDGYSRKFYHSLKYDKWVDDHTNKVYYRSPNHLNAIRRDIAIQSVFPDIVIGEDRIYSANIRPKLKTQIDLIGTNYFYKCKKTFEETHGFSRNLTNEHIVR